jgi:FSR family fosmidomycin resistance protein-like MFS transporter
MVARWTLAGTVGNLVGPLLLAGSLALGFGWRWLYLGLAFICLGFVIMVLKKEFPPRSLRKGRPGEELIDVLRGAWKAVRNLHLLRWIVLLQFSDLLLDIFTGFLALYFTEAIGIKNAQAGVVVSAYIAASLAADVLVVRLLERIPGRKLVRFTAAIMLVVYPLWLLVPWTWAKLALLLVLPFCRMGWYPVLEGESFATIPERSATVNFVGSLGGPLAAGLAYMVSAAAEAFTLPAAMWLLLLGPLFLVLFVPREETRISISDRDSIS